ncbi:type IX secretion system ring protein PorN/GldN [Mucilaginibacter terrae]|uniref:Gliding motility associated protein GldN n=1 Tax=Mucilaginibacter terrae TaxID=1955052 RepID=A0ABU3GT59_9SPHI|nr:gliding motility protein GldN [Mucilaginibacter terrae]MDT3402820.1 gliding motility associated protein GldN [Mucilaginibacter terrae]
MRRKIFVVGLLSLICLSTFAQKRGTARKRTTTKKAVTTAPQTANTTFNAQPVVDTGKKAKAFERPMDGFYKKANILSARVSPYANIREADVVYAKRIWREIDLREKMNQYLSSPKARLIDVLMEAVEAGELTAYDANPSKDDPNGDAFAVPLTPGKAKGKMADSTVVDKFDKDGNKIGSSLQAGDFNADSVIRFRIKEDWVFDRQRSVFEPRIIGIAPLIKLKAAGIETDFQPAFWIYFPEARQVLATKEAISRNNDATGLSFDDVFMKRLFASVIVKVSNQKDERIKDYAQGIDKLYESEKVKKSLMDWELGLWQY